MCGEIHLLVQYSDNYYPVAYNAEENEMSTHFGSSAAFTKIISEIGRAHV